MGCVRGGLCVLPFVVGCGLWGCVLCVVAGVVRWFACFVLRRRYSVVCLLLALSNYISYK